MPAKDSSGTKLAATKHEQPTRLWLSLLEDINKVEWPPTVEGQRWRVELTSSDTLHGCNHNGLYRTSPVFPATQHFRTPDIRSGIYYFCFYCFDPAFPVLGRLSRKGSQDLKAGLLYTIGLASILLVTKRRSLADAIEQIAGVSARAKEVWHVDRGRIKSILCECPALRTSNSTVITLLAYGALPLVAKTTVDEFVANMALLIPKVQLHLPGEMRTYTRLVGLVNELVNEMLYVSNPIDAPPETLSEYTEKQFAASASLRNRILYQNIDRLVQINSALSYVSTQALSGAVPILDRRSLIRRYSLLGVGTAVLALTRIAHSIESAFAQGALEQVLSDRGMDLLPLPGLDKLPDYKTNQWKDFSIDSVKGKVKPREAYPKLPYFSGRLGFRETEYTISAALQTLAAGGSEEWSLLTVTHEMVHGHVRNLLSVLFQGDPNGRPDHKWKEFYDRFETRCKGNPPARENLLDSLRSVILSYCCTSVKLGSLTKDLWNPANSPGDQEIKISLPLLSPESLLLVYETEYRNISEILVHVLDLHYFYNSSLSNYIPLIWRSWSKAPQVRGDLRQYLLRCLLVIAVKTEGTPHERFHSARSRLLELLQSLQEHDGARIPVIDEAAARLERDYTEKHLFFSFLGSLILVDTAHHVLTSSRIRGAINAGDTHLRPTAATTNEEWLEYDMPDGFVDDVVMSPTAYIAHRLTQPISDGKGRDIEAETAALFLACSSHEVEGVIHG